MKRVRILVSGKVHGVYFRANTEQTARELGLTGFVRNEPGGTVYIEAQGPPEKINNLVAWCRNGPERARVDEVMVSDIDLISETSFGIKR